MCIGERAKYTDGSLAVGRGPWREVPDREMPRLDLGHGAGILT